MNKKLSLSAYAGTIANAKADCSRLRVLVEQAKRKNIGTFEQIDLEDKLGRYWELLEVLIDALEKDA